MTNVAVVKSLGELAREINETHAACESAYQGALDHALHCGQLLEIAKQHVAHGDWMDWLEANFAGSYRTAARYMQLAEAQEAGELPQVADFAGVAEAAAAIAKPGPAPKAKAEESLARLGSTEGAMDELGMPDPTPSFPRPGMEQRTWREIRGELSKVERKMETARATDLSDWSRAEYLEQAAKAAGEASQLLAELARALR